MQLKMAFTLLELSIVCVHIDTMVSRLKQVHRHQGIMIPRHWGRGLYDNQICCYYEHIGKAFHLLVICIQCVSIIQAIKREKLFHLS